MSNDLTLTDIKTVVDEAMNPKFKNSSEKSLNQLLMTNGLKQSTTKQFVSTWIMLFLSLSKLVMILKSERSVKS